MPYVHSLLIPYVYVPQTFSLRSTGAQTKRSNRKPMLEALVTNYKLLESDTTKSISNVSSV